MKKNINKIILLLRKEVPSDKAVVWNEDPFRVLIATILSQRTRDENTRKATEKLFSRFSKPKQIAGADLRELRKLIKPSGFYRVKAERIKKVSKQLMNEFSGMVPEKIEDLLKLEGVGRKTANCVLVYGFNLPAIPVDTHVHRISNRIGLVKTKNPEETEKELMKAIPKKYWIEFNHLMVRFGQKKCLPRNPKCRICSVNTYCDYFEKNY
ncbi:MAG: endonuclease III [archaeon]|nr:endonuclease III [Candidatus Micrarchaeota archaeon]